MTDGLEGMPYTVIEYRFGTNWLGFGRREIVRTVFEWTGPDLRGNAMSRTLLREVEESRLIWRGFSQDARRCHTRTLESGLMPGAVMREVPEAERE
jgi:hypothetical protein